MNEETREELYKILYLLARQEENFGRVVDLMNDLIPRGKYSFPLGYWAGTHGKFRLHIQYNLGYRSTEGN